MSLTLIVTPQKYLFLTAKTRGMKQNEVFVFQRAEIQCFVRRQMNPYYLLISVIVSNFATEVYPHC